MSGTRRGNRESWIRETPNDRGQEPDDGAR